MSSKCYSYRDYYIVEWKMHHINHDITTCSLVVQYFYWLLAIMIIVIYRSLLALNYIQYYIRHAPVWFISEDGKQKLAEISCTEK